MHSRSQSGVYVRKSFTAGTPAGCASDGGGGDLAGASPSASAVPAATGPNPTFSYPGDPECSITYGSNQAGTTTWAATVTESGELITHASGNQGDINRRDAQVTSGPNSFTAPEPLNYIGDVRGVLYVGSSSYGCSIAPAR